MEDGGDVTARRQERPGETSETAGKLFCLETAKERVQMSSSGSFSQFQADQNQEVIEKAT